MPGVAGDSMWLRGIGYSVWEGLWLKNAINIVPFSELVISYSYSLVLMMVFWFKTTQELTTVVLWTIHDAEMALQRRNEGWGGRLEVEKKMQVCMLFDHIWLVQVLQAASTWQNENSLSIILPQHWVCFPK